MSAAGIIIPTFNNMEYLVPCVKSLVSPHITEDIYHIYIVNNGHPDNMKFFSGFPKITIIQADENLGWEGGLKAGLEFSKEEIVIFMNDDTFIPLNSIRWINHLLDRFEDPKVGAVGPSSNTVMGAQNIFVDGPADVFRVNFLIGFCMAVRRKALEEAGGIDDTLPGGDDLDLSIRLRKAGYDLICDKNAFVYHHGFKTGERVEGPASVPNGWNSVQKIEKTNWALINKHGLKEWMECMNQVPEFKSACREWTADDTEGNVVRQFVVGDKVVEIGCGMKKTLPHVVGVDRVPRGTSIPGLPPNTPSLADVVGDAQGGIPLDSESFDTVIARHILEHCVDAVSAVREWGRLLRHDGRLIIAVPDHTSRNTIPMNHEHVHAWTPESLKRFMEIQGWKTVDLLDPKNHVSFVGVFSKNGLH